MALDNERLQGVQNHPLLFLFWCVGCDEPHQVPVNGYTKNGYSWGWNGSKELPTFTPSLLLKNGHFAQNFQPGDPCWCTYNKEHADNPAPFECSICHSFVRDGRIEYLNDCTHKFAGQTVDIPTWNSTREKF